MGSIISQLVGYAHETQLNDLRQRGEWLRATAADPNLDEATRGYAASELNKLGAKVESHKEKKAKLLDTANAHQNILNQYLQGSGNIPEPMAAEAHGALSKMLPDHVRESFDHFGEQTLPSLGAQPPTPPPAPQLTGGNSAANPSVQVTQLPPPPSANTANAGNDPNNPFASVASQTVAPPAQASAQQVDLPPAPGNITAPNVSPTRSMPPSNIGSGPSAGFSVPNAPVPTQQAQPMPAPPSTANGFRFHPFTPEEQGQRQLAKALPEAQMKNDMVQNLYTYFRKQAIDSGITDPVQIENLAHQKTAAFAPITNLRPGGKAVDHTGKVIATGGPQFITTPAGAVTTQVNSDGGQGLPTPPGVDGQPSASAQPQSSVIASPPAILPPTQRRENAFYEAKHGMKPGTLGAEDYAKATKEYKDDSRTDTEKQEIADKHESAVSLQENRKLNQERIKNVLAKAANVNAGVIPSEDLSFVAKQDLLTGKTTSFARGPDQAVNQANYLQARRQAAEEQGMNPNEVVSRQAQVKADSTALAQLEKQTTAIESFANNTDRNFQLALKLGDKVDRTNSPVVNRWLLKLKGQYQGDPNVTAFEAALNTAATDWAKVTTGQTSGQAVTDSARTKYDQMVSSALSGKSLRNLYTEAVLPELDNRKQSLDAERKKLISRISGKQPISAPPASSIHMRAPNGQISTVPADQVEHYKQKGAVVVQ